MRILSTVFVLIFIGILPAHSNTMQFSGRFAVVNSERIFNETNLAKSMIAILQSEFTARQEGLREEAKRIVSAASELDKQANRLSANDLRSKQQDLVRQDLNLQEAQKKFTEDLNKRTFEERAKIAVAANVALKNFATKENISVIVQEAAYLDASSDITNQIISLLNGDKNLSSVSFEGPKLSRILIVNSQRYYQNFGVVTGPTADANLLKKQNEFAARANEALKLIAENNQVNIVLQEAAFVTPNNEITDKLIEAVKNKNFEKSNLIIDSLNLPTTFAIVNSSEIFSKFPNKNRQKLAEAANVALNKISQEKGINVILQEAAYLSPSHDVTASVIKLIIPPIENEVSPTSNSNVPATNPTKNLADAKAKCLDLGFKVGTESFGNCVLKISK